MKIVATLELPHELRSAANHTVSGVEIESAVRLKIVQFNGENGHYLIRYGKLDQELTDTLHDDIAGAIDQAKFEYGADPNSWVFSSS